MVSQSIFGMPRRCLNRNCRAVFYKESHLGWQPKSEMEIYAIMRCPSCRDTFMVVQTMSMGHDYYQRLGNDPMRRPISKKEVERARQRLALDPNPLSTLRKSRPNLGKGLQEG